MTSYRLIPSLAFARLDEACYIYDRDLVDQRVLVVPTQRISATAHAALLRLHGHLEQQGPVSPVQLDQLFAAHPQQRQAIARLREAGYLERVKNNTQDTQCSPEPPSGGEAEEFLAGGLGHYLSPSTLFHVPPDVAEAEADVAVVGVPIASRPISQGTVAGPAYLRQLSQRVAHWFGVYAHGMAALTSSGEALPRAVGKGLRLRDGGDVGHGSETVEALFEQLDRVVGRACEAGPPTLFVGGDHAITFPIVDAFVRRHPDLCLLHFDAHHDVFYDRRVAFDHATVIRGLLLHSGLRDVYSFGLRSTPEARAPGLEAFRASPALAERLHPFTLLETRRMILDPARLRALLRTIPAERPCYLTIDLDVLSADAIQGRVSTPAGPGLAWAELHEAVRIIFEERRVVGADLVELCPANASAPGAPQELVGLTLSLLEGLGGHRAASAGSSPGA